MSVLLETAVADQIRDMIADGETISDLSKSLDIPEADLIAIRDDADAALRAASKSRMQDPEERSALYDEIKAYQYKRNPATNRFYTQKAVAQLMGVSTAQVGKIWRSPENAPRISAHMPDQAAWRIMTLIRILQGRYSASDLSQMGGVARVQVTMLIAWLRKAANLAVQSTDAGKKSVFYCPDYKYLGDAPNPIAAVGVHAEPVPPPVDAGDELPPVVAPQAPKTPVDQWRTIEPDKAQIILEFAGVLPQPRVAELMGVDISTVCLIWQGKRRKTLVAQNPIAQKFLEQYRAQNPLPQD
jgi:hypothetical protein